MTEIRVREWMYRAHVDLAMFPETLTCDGAQWCAGHMAPMAIGQGAYVSRDGRLFCAESAAHISTCTDSLCDCRYGF